MVINKNINTIHPRFQTVICDRNEDFLRVKEDEASEQLERIFEALKADASKWTFEQIDFLAVRHGAVVEDDFYNKLERPNIQAGKRDKILEAHVQRMCEAHDTVMRFYYQYIHGSSGVDAMTSMENIGYQMYVYIVHNIFIISCCRKVKTGQSLSKISKPTALHTEGTAQVSEWFNISDTAKKLE